MSEAVAVETPAVEAVPAAPAEPPKEAPKVEEAPKPKPGDFAAKAKAERERVQKANEAKSAAAEAERYKAEAAKLQARVEEMENRRRSYTENPLQALIDAFPGMTPAKAFELVAEAAKNGGKAPPSAEVYAVRQELERERQERAEWQKKQEEAARAQAEETAKQTEARFRAEVAEFVQGNAEEYELTAKFGRQQDVADLIVAHHANTGKILSYKEAAAKIESEIEKVLEEGIKTKKLQAKLKPPPPKDDTPKTLTNDLAAQTTKTGPMTEEERMRRARKALEDFMPG